MAEIGEVNYYLATVSQKLNLMCPETGSHLHISNTAEAAGRERLTA